MVKDEILVVKMKTDGLNFKIKDKGFNSWSPSSYENVISSKDSTKLALLLYDLEMMGFPVEQAVVKFRNLSDKPKDFFFR